MEGIELLRLEHRQLLDVFDELEFTTGTLERTRLLGQLAELLKAHAALEEEVFYPAIRVTGIPGAAEIVDEALAAHRAADLVLDETLGAEASVANVKVLRDVVEAHFDDEEQRLLPLVEQLGDTTRAALATRIERRADELHEDDDDDSAAAYAKP